MNSDHTTLLGQKLKLHGEIFMDQSKPVNERVKHMLPTVWYIVRIIGLNQFLKATKWNELWRRDQ
jgi:hypothetical protein